MITKNCSMPINYDFICVIDYVFVWFPNTSLVIKIINNSVKLNELDTLVVVLFKCFFPSRKLYYTACFPGEFRVLLFCSKYAIIISSHNLILILHESVHH